MKEIKFSPPDISQEEIDQVVEALKSGWITTGPKTKEFESKISEYLGTKKSVCLNSATACMEMALRILGIGPGDEVITSVYTYTASASVIAHVGAKIVLCDIAENSFEMDYDKLSQLITEKTKAIIPVDIGGVPCDYDRLIKVLEDKKSLFKPKNKRQERIGRLAIVSDSAHSFGATYKGKHVANYADMTSYSFHAVKNLTTAEGGALTWRDGVFENDEEIYKELQLLSLHGQSKDALSKMKLGAWEYDIVAPNYKCNMTDIMAGLGLAQLKRYESLLNRRKEIIERYNKGFENSRIKALVHFTEDKKSTGHLYIVNIEGMGKEERNTFIEKMAEGKIATNVHYKPLPMHTAYKNLGFDIKDFPNSYKRYINEVTLPLHTLLTDEDVDRIIDLALKLVG